ncbi:MAG TPA: pentapeptide repeat-containing protein [Amycolatopsis sp.]|nr:pentapeptide repeat-containing protein [Amycolatopsis sp.]HKS48693.1 pentapeptide repeat-containing protein [Amycolatopsis sp.]
MAEYRWLLVASLLGSASALLLVTGWLLTDSRVSTADALKTGGLAGGAIIALYALWLNDRRRRSDEMRQEIELTRVRQDRERVSDERFAKAIELLGNDADQVRVGALYALAGLARSRPEYARTTIDVLCSYLRRPFTHPSYEIRPGDPDQADVEPDQPWTPEGITAADRERQVRLTAQRLIAELLPDVGATASYDLDLTEASLEYLNLSGRQLGSLTARRAKLFGMSRLNGMRVHEPALFSGAVFHGDTNLANTRFDGGLSLQNVVAGGAWLFEDATVGSFLDLRAKPPKKQTGTLSIAAGIQVKLNEHESGWATAPGQPASGA